MSLLYAEMHIQQNDGSKHYQCQIWVEIEHAAGRVYVQFSYNLTNAESVTVQLPVHQFTDLLHVH